MTKQVLEADGYIYSLFSWDVVYFGRKQIRGIWWYDIKTFGQLCYVVGVGVWEWECGMGDEGWL